MSGARKRLCSVRSVIGGAIVAAIATAIVVPVQAQPQNPARTPPEPAPDQSLPTPPSASQTNADLERAQEALDAGDTNLALRLFREIHEASKDPRATVGLARTQAKLGRPKAALLTLDALLARTDLTSAERDEGQGERDDIAKRVATLTFEIPDGVSGLRVRIDDVAVDDPSQPYLLIPGRHTVRAAARGGREFVKDINLQPGASLSIKLELARPVEVQRGPVVAPAESTWPFSPIYPEVVDGGKTMRTLGIVTGVTGLVTLLVAAETGALFMSEKAAVDNNCETPTLCNADGLEAAKRAETLGLINTVTLFSGLGLTTLGAVLFLAAPSPSAKTPEAAPTETGGAAAWLRPAVGPSHGGFVIEGRF